MWRGGQRRLLSTGRFATSSRSSASAASLQHASHTVSRSAMMIASKATTGPSAMRMHSTTALSSAASNILSQFAANSSKRHVVVGVAATARATHVRALSTTSPAGRQCASDARAGSRLVTPIDSITIQRRSGSTGSTRPPSISSFTSSSRHRPAITPFLCTFPSSSSTTQLQLHHLRRRSRTFHSTRPTHDVFFVAFPALKSALLNVTRAGLLTLPFVWRWRLWKKYRRFSMILVNVPLLAFCLVLALGLDQCPRTQRWRLLLMTEPEEMAWSRRKFDEVLAEDGSSLLPSSDPRTQRVTRVATRLVAALEDEQNQSGDERSGGVGRKFVHSAESWPPTESRDELARAIAGREKGGGREAKEPEPSATTTGAGPFQTGDVGEWKIWVIGEPKVNAFALPSRDIFVYAGLVDLVDDDTLLAAVMAHEIAHVTQRHAVENLGFLNLAAVAFDVLRGVSFALTISFPFITDSAAVFINWLNDVVAQRAYSRKLEMEADQFMAAAGYDPRAAIDLWDLMAAVEADAASHGESPSLEDRLSLLRTHPTSQARQEAIARLMPKALGVFEESLKRGGPLAKKARKAGPVKSYLSRPVSTADAAATAATSDLTEGESSSSGATKNPLGLPPRRQKIETVTSTSAAAAAAAATSKTYHASLQTSTNFLPLGSRTHVKPAVPLKEVSLGSDESRPSVGCSDQSSADASKVSRSAEAGGVSETQHRERNFGEGSVDDVRLV